MYFNIIKHCLEWDVILSLQTNDQLIHIQSITSLSKIFYKYFCSVLSMLYLLFLHLFSSYQARKQNILVRNAMISV
jgi:hypothetical protein